jgi:hypothetical protein
MTHYTAILTPLHLHEPWSTTIVWAGLATDWWSARERALQVLSTTPGKPVLRVSFAALNLVVYESPAVPLAELKRFWKERKKFWKEQEEASRPPARARRAAAKPAKPAKKKRGAR